MGKQTLQLGLNVATRLLPCTIQIQTKLIVHTLELKVSRASQHFYIKHLQQQLQFSTQLADSLSAPPKARPEVSKVAPHPWNQTPNFFHFTCISKTFPFLFSFPLPHASSLVLSLLHNITFRTHAIHIYIHIITYI